MSIAPTRERLQLPASLQTQLHGFRQRVWAVKMIEAGCRALCGILVAFLVMFAADRLWDPPAAVRVGLFISVLLAVSLVPLAWHRWVWGNRRPDQLARLLSRKLPLVGDQLLGVIELVRNDAEQTRSRALCQAAIQQVAEDATKRDLRNAIPHPRHRQWAGFAAVPAVIALGIGLAVPAAAVNTWARLLAPWLNTPRYTFAVVEPLPDKLVVPHGEAFPLTVQLAPGTGWRPDQATVQLGDNPPVAVAMTENGYRFELSPQVQPGQIRVRVGDARHTLRIEPMLRPELTSIAAEISLPKYLELPQPLKKDVRGGTTSAVIGSRVRFTAVASRELAGGTIAGATRPPAGTALTSAEIEIAGSQQVEFRWRDQFGLEGREPFVLTVTGRDDEAPTLFCEGLPRQKVVLDIEQLSFEVKARDDFGIRRIGLEWQGVASPVISTPAKGERLLSPGAPDKDSLEVKGTFSARALGIEPQQVNVRVFTEDYFPGRERAYSPVYSLYVLNSEQHAIWLTEQLSKWHRQSLEVRDRELQLFETNKQLRELSAEELNEPDTRRRIEAQAAGERANGKRLSNLVVSGEDLVRQAMRNPEFGVGHLEKWAEMLQILKDISGNRMPSVADLLKEAAQVPQIAQAELNRKSAQAGQNRANAGGKPSSSTEKKSPPSAVPTIADGESTHQTPDKNAKSDPPSEKKPSNPRLTLPQTTVIGSGKSPPKPPAPADEKMDEAVRQQQDLLAEFEKIAEELNNVLANLEGSTLVKRLKAASRVQYAIAGRMGDEVNATFGVSVQKVKKAAGDLFADLSKQEAQGSQTVSLIMDDMQAYFERRRMVKFKTVLDEMREQDVIGSLRQLGDDLKQESGLSIAQCEFWSDTLDRWADDLVDPSKCGACPGGKSKGSLPPSIVLEVLQILEGEVNLREETRVAEQARAGVSAEAHQERANGLSQTQDALRDRVDKVIVRIRDLPDAESDFGKELQLLGMVSQVMTETVGILATPETGSPAIAAETEAIELLLQSRKINPNGGGGGGGSSPGGGGGGNTIDSALALIGRGLNEKEVREDHGVAQSSGEAGSSLPEEFRAGLDEYFNRLERDEAR